MFGRAVACRSSTEQPHHGRVVQAAKKLTCSSRPDWRGVVPSGAELGPSQRAGAVSLGRLAGLACRASWCAGLLGGSRTEERSGVGRGGERGEGARGGSDRVGSGVSLARLFALLLLLLLLLTGCSRNHRQVLGKPARCLCTATAVRRAPASAATCTVRTQPPPPRPGRPPLPLVWFCLAARSL